MIKISKVIAIYNSRTRNTKKVAMKIAEGLVAESYDYKHIPNLKDYDLVVVGSWVIMGRTSFAGARYLRRLQQRKLTGKKVAFFFTSGAPDEIHPFTENKETPKTIKELMFDKVVINLPDNLFFTHLNSV